MRNQIKEAMRAVLYNSTHDNLDKLIIALGLNPEDEIHRNSVMNVMFTSIDNKRLNEERTEQALLNLTCLI